MAHNLGDPRSLYAGKIVQGLLDHSGCIAAVHDALATSLIAPKSTRP